MDLRLSHEQMEASQFPKLVSKRDQHDPKDVIDMDLMKEEDSIVLTFGSLHEGAEMGSMIFQCSV